MWRNEDDQIEFAKEEVANFLDKNPENVFYSRQIEVIFEDKYFHWITNAALRSLAGIGTIKSEKDKTNYGDINLYWNKGYRYYKRRKKYIIDAVNYFSNPEFTRAIGNHAEMLIAEALFVGQFSYYGREMREYKGIRWEKTDHDLDFIVEKDGISYGIEVKNTLGYIDEKELDTKVEMCEKLGLVPVFACRMLPKCWINEKIVKAGGFAWIMKYQFYPYNEQNRAKEYKKGLLLPVDSPRRIYNQTIDRFKNFHFQKLEK